MHRVHFDGMYFLFPLQQPKAPRKMSVFQFHLFFFSFFKPTANIHRSNGNPLGTCWVYQWPYSYRKWLLLQKPETTNSNPGRNEASGTPQSMLKLILHGFCEVNHSCCEFMIMIAMSKREHFVVFLHPLTLHIVSSPFSDWNISSPWLLHFLLSMFQIFSHYLGWWNWCRCIV